MNGYIEYDIIKIVSLFVLFTKIGCRLRYRVAGFISLASKEEKHEVRI